jgi:hypothetical protein
MSKLLNIRIQNRRQRKILLLMIMCFLVLNVKFSNAQDTIYTKDGREIKAKIISNDGSNLKYRAFNNLNGPIRNFDVSFIDFIKYEDGTIERFVVSKNQKDITQNVTTDPTLDFLKKKYERNLSVVKFGKGMQSVGFFSLALALVGAIEGGDPELTNVLATGGGILALSGLVVAAVGNSRAEHFNDRINKLSLIMVPNHLMIANNNLPSKGISFGLRLTF